MGNVRDVWNSSNHKLLVRETLLGHDNFCFPHTLDEKQFITESRDFENKLGRSNIGSYIVQAHMKQWKPTSMTTFTPGSHDMVAWSRGRWQQGLQCWATLACREMDLLTTLQPIKVLWVLNKTNWDFRWVMAVFFCLIKKVCGKKIYKDCVR